MMGLQTASGQEVFRLGPAQYFGGNWSRETASAIGLSTRPARQRSQVVRSGCISAVRRGATLEAASAAIRSSRRLPAARRPRRARGSSGTGGADSAGGSRGPRDRADWAAGAPGGRRLRISAIVTAHFGIVTGASGIVTDGAGRGGLRSDEFRRWNQLAVSLSSGFVGVSGRCRRRDSPLRLIRCSRASSRSRIASAIVASPNQAC